MVGDELSSRNVSLLCPLGHLHIQQVELNMGLKPGDILRLEIRMWGRQEVGIIEILMNGSRDKI